MEMKEQEGQLWSLFDSLNRMCYFDRLMVDFEYCKNWWFVLRRPYVVHGMLKSKNWETEENTGFEWRLERRKELACPIVNGSWFQVEGSCYEKEGRPKVLVWKDGILERGRWWKLSGGCAEFRIRNVFRAGSTQRFKAQWQIFKISLFFRLKPLWGRKKRCDVNKFGRPID